MSLPITPRNTSPATVQCPRQHIEIDDVLRCIRIAMAGIGCDTTAVSHINDEVGSWDEIVRHIVDASQGTRLTEVLEDDEVAKERS